MIKRNAIFLAVLITVVAFCTSPAESKLSEITNSNLLHYATERAKEGSLAIPVTARALYREALLLLKDGKRDKAKEKLILASTMDNEFAQPLFTLSRVEMMHGDVEFLPHLLSGLLRSVRTFKNQALFIANGYIFIVAALIGALFVISLALILKYHAFVTHRLRENYKKKYSFPNDKWFMIILLVSLAAMRLGLALYIGIFTILTLRFATRRERAAVLSLALLLASLSICSPFTKPVAVALDPESATYKFWRLARSVNNEALLSDLRQIDDPALAAEKEFAIGTVMAKIGRLAEAREHLLKAIERKKDFAAAYINLGNLYYTSGDYDKALVGYMNAIEADSLNAIAYYNLGQTYIKNLLFAKSSSSLAKANELGIEDLKSIYRAITNSEPDIFTAYLDLPWLWRVAKVESRKVDVSYLDDLFQPALLIPFKYLWIVIVSSLLIASILPRLKTKNFEVVECENCGSDTCSGCSNRDMEITLCRDCAKLIDGLSSVKVMEALLRHRRQKVAKRREKKQRWKMNLFPGIAYVFHGRPATGGIIAFISSLSIAWIAWGGGYFKDIFGVSGTFSVWKIVPPVFILSASFLASLRSKPAVEPRNYRILPHELHREDTQGKQEDSIEGNNVETEEKEPVMLF